VFFFQISKLEFSNLKIGIFKFRKFEGYKNKIPSSKTKLKKLSRMTNSDAPLMLCSSCCYPYSRRFTPPLNGQCLCCAVNFDECNQSAVAVLNDRFNTMTLAWHNKFSDDKKGICKLTPSYILKILDPANLDNYSDQDLGNASRTLEWIKDRFSVIFLLETLLKTDGTYIDKDHVFKLMRCIEEYRQNVTGCAHVLQIKKHIDTLRRIICTNTLFSQERVHQVGINVLCCTKHRTDPYGFRHVDSECLECPVEKMGGVACDSWFYRRKEY
jgi:hypothetical protein